MTKNATFANLLSFLLTFQFLPAQTPDTLWTRTFGYGRGNCVLETLDHGYVLVGSIASLSNDILLLKTNSMGDTIWTKKFGGADYEAGYSVRQTADGGFIIAGTTSSYGAGGNDVWLIKTNEYGDTIWTKTFGGTGFEVGNCIQITNDGGYIILGSTSSYGVGGESVWLIRTDLNGNILWTKTFVGNYGEFVQETSDNGYIIVGSTGEAVWLMKTDLNGNTLWTKTYNFYWQHEFGQCVIETNNGYMVSVRGRDGIIFKTDFTGDTLWTKRLLIGDESIHHSCNSITMTKTGNYLIGGSSFYYSGVDPTSYGGWIILTDNNGNILWQKDLCGGWGYGGIFSAIQASDSGFVATGSTGGIWGSSLIFLAKITPSVTGLEKSGDVVTKDFSLSPNYPNPFNSSTTIGFNLLKTSEVKLKIFNIIGEEVAILVSEKLAAGNYKYKWDAGGLASSIYFYRLEVNGTLHQHKLILMK